MEKPSPPAISFGNTDRNNNSGNNNGSDDGDIKKKQSISLSRTSTGQSSDDGKSIRSAMMEKMKFVKRSRGKSQVVRVEGPPYHTMALDTVVQLLKSDLDEGLSEAECARRQKEECGFNEMEGEGGINPFKLLLKQFINILVLILLIAMVSFKPRFLKFHKD
jgi:magnesium-transporting ATPase (P-type)